MDNMFKDAVFMVLIGLSAFGFIYFICNEVFVTKLQKRVSELMKRVIELELQNQRTQEEKEHRNQILTSAEMILNKGIEEEYRATSADE